MKVAPIRVTAHRPERRRRSLVTLHCGGGCCCCCCCCCLHSIGSLIGATVAPKGERAPAGPAYLPADDDEPASGVSGVSVYWWCLLAVIAVAFAFGLATGHATGGLIALGAIIVLLPLLQLFASLLAMLILAASSQPDRSYQFGQVGRITLGAVVGGLAGLGIMILLAVLLLGSNSLLRL